MRTDHFARSALALTIALAIVGVTAPPAAAGAGDASRAEGPLVALVARDAPAPPSWTLEAADVTVREFTLERTSLVGVALSSGSGPTVVERAHGAAAATGSARSVDAFVAAVPAGPASFAFTGDAADAHVSAAGAGALDAAPTGDAASSGAAFRVALAGDHVRFAPGRGAHVVDGSFTLRAWGVSLTVRDADGGETAYHTGVTVTTDVAGVRRETWRWVDVDVREGTLSVAAAGSVDVRVGSLLLDQPPPAVATHFTATEHGLAAAAVADPAPVQAAAAPAAPLAWWPVAVAAVAMAGGGAWAAGLRRRAPTPVPGPPAPTAGPGVDAFLENGRRALQAGEPVQALKWFDLAVALEPHSGIAHFCRALCLEGLERTRDAHEAFQRAAREDPGNGVAHYHHARSLLWFDGHAESMAALARAVALSPELAAMAEQDDGFRALMDHPRFLALVGRL